MALRRRGLQSLARGGARHARGGPRPSPPRARAAVVSPLALLHRSQSHRPAVWLHRALLPPVRLLADAHDATAARVADDRLSEADVDSRAGPRAGGPPAARGLQPTRRD